ncbi:glycosyltransferase family 4 protein [Chloroflexia bacterium SDU3-3]|nr:glycosyltransferase family 4 protein [Chloroflexia bacterium SDU3-3]
MSMRVMIVSDVYPPLIGGVERQMQVLGQMLRQRGHEVCVATPWQEGLAPYEEADGVAIHRLRGVSALLAPAKGAKRRHHPPAPDPATVWQLRRLIDRFRPDVVHVYGWIAYSCAAALVGRRTPMLLSVREYGYTCALRTMMHHGKELCSGPAPAKCLSCAASYFGPAKGVVATVGVWSGRGLLRGKTAGLHSVSHYMQQNIRRDLYDDQVPPQLPDAVIPSFRNDADSASEAELRPYLEQLPDEPFILFVGALRLVKGLGPLLEAYAALRDAPPLVLIGRMASDTPRSFPPNVRVLYDFPHPAVMAAWGRSLFGVAPSVWPEPFGSVIHEAMSQGKAVVGTTPGGQTDMIVDGETGLLVPAGDAGALAQAMQRLIDDPALRERLGEASRVRARLFTAELVVPQFEQLYRQLIAQSRGNAFESDHLSIS